MKMTKAQLQEARRAGSVVEEKKSVPTEGVTSPPKEVESTPELASPLPVTAAQPDSSAAFEAQAEATRLVVASNTELIGRLAETLKEVLGDKPFKELYFDIERDETVNGDYKPMKRIHVRSAEAKG